MAPARPGMASRRLMEQLSRSSSESSGLGPSPAKPCLEAEAASPEAATQLAPREDREVPFEELLAQISRSKEQMPKEPEKPWVPPQPRWDHGDTPFMVGSSVPRCFEPQNPGFLHPRQFGQWDQERIIAPERTWPSRGRAAELYDHHREGLPDWKPGGSAGRTGEVFPFVAARERQGARRSASSHRRTSSAKQGTPAPSAAWGGRPASPRAPPALLWQQATTPWHEPPSLQPTTPSRTCTSPTGATSPALVAGSLNARFLITVERISADEKAEFVEMWESDQTSELGIDDATKLSELENMPVN